MVQKLTGERVMTSPLLLTRACRQLKLIDEQQELPLVTDQKRVRVSRTLAPGETVQGYEVQFPNWHQPCYYDLAGGRVFYDDYNGRWGDTADLRRLETAYGAELEREAVESAMELAGVTGASFHQEVEGDLLHLVLENY
jgi:hypothetical protein